MKLYYLQSDRYWLQLVIDHSPNRLTILDLSVMLIKLCHYEFFRNS
jgi:hypothetical protein